MGGGQEPPDERQELIEQLDRILDGIDREECEYDNAWWETSTGAEFGAKKKAEIKMFVTQHTQVADTSVIRKLYNLIDPDAWESTDAQLHNYEQILEVIEAEHKQLEQRKKEKS